MAADPFVIPSCRHCNARDKVIVAAQEIANGTKQYAWWCEHQQVRRLGNQAGYLAATGTARYQDEKTWPLTGGHPHCA